MDKDEINIPQRGRPRKSREMGFQPSSPVQHERVQIDFEGMLDVDGEESVNDLLQREYRKYVDRNKLDINQNNLENYLKPKDLNRKRNVRGDKPRVDFEKRDTDTRREMFQSQGQILSHISSIFPEKSVAEDFAEPHLREERVKRSEAHIEVKLGLAPRDDAECGEFMVGQFQGGECGTGGALALGETHAGDGKAARAAGPGSACKERCGDDVSQAAPAHGSAYGTGDRAAGRDSATGGAKQGDACAQKVCVVEALGHRGGMSDADYSTERYGSPEAGINKSSEFSPRFGARHEGDFYGLEPRQNSHRSLYSGGQADVAVDYAQRRYYASDQKMGGVPGNHGGRAHGRIHRRDPMYQYEMHEYCDHMQGDGHTFPVAGCNFVTPMSEQHGASSFSMCRQGRFQDGLHGAEGFAGYKRDDRDGFLQQRAECGFVELKGVGELDMAQQAAYWCEDPVGYQSGMQYSMGVDALRFQGGRRAADAMQDVHSGFEPPPHLYRPQDGDGDKFSASDQSIAQYINSKYSAGTSLGQTLSHSSNVSSFEPNPNNPLFQNYSMWVNRKKRKNNPLLWQYINQGHSFVHPSKYSNLDYVHKKMYLGTITQIPIEKNNHQILPLFLNSTSNTPEFVKIGSIFLEKTRGLNYDNVTVMQLKNLMKEFGLCHNGKKTELIERVKATVEKIEQKMNKKKEMQSAESHTPESEGREEGGNVDMNDVTDDAAFMYF